jgi:S-adenosylmethionine/arginine decarboxylase-like enzyme
MKAKMYNHSQWIKETNSQILKENYTLILEKSGFNIIDNIEHYFNPFGYTSLFLLSESHLAIHTFPEEQTTYVELSSCVEKPFIKYKELLNKKHI